MVVMESLKNGREFFSPIFYFYSIPYTIQKSIKKPLLMETSQPLLSGKRVSQQQELTTQCGIESDI